MFEEEAWCQLNIQDLSNGSIIRRWREGTAGMIHHTKAPIHKTASYHTRPSSLANVSNLKRMLRVETSYIIFTCKEY